MRPRLVNKSRPKLAVPSRPKLKEQPAGRPKLRQPFEPMINWDKFHVGSPMPKRRKWAAVKGLFVMPLLHALPDPHWPEWRVNLDHSKFAVVLNKKVIRAAATRADALEYANRVAELVRLRVVEVKSA